MRYLGIDYGLKRIGLALSDPEGRMAFPFKTVARLDDIAAVVKNERVGCIIMGLPPPGRSRAWQRQNAAVKRCAGDLAKTVQLPIEFEDEAFTTKIAERHTAKDKADASAAAIILQSYLDRQQTKV